MLAETNDYILSKPEWQAVKLAELRDLILAVDARISESFKWRTPHFEFKGVIVGLAAFKKHMVVHFHQGSELEDRHGLFYASDAKGMRGYRLEEGDEIKEEGLRDLVRQAIALKEGK